MNVEIRTNIHNISKHIDDAIKLLEAIVEIDGSELCVDIYRKEVGKGHCVTKSGVWIIRVCGTDAVTTDGGLAQAIIAAAEKVRSYES